MHHTGAGHTWGLPLSHACILIFLPPDSQAHFCTEEGDLLKAAWITWCGQVVEGNPQPACPIMPTPPPLTYSAPAPPCRAWVCCWCSGCEGSLEVTETRVTTYHLWVFPKPLSLCLKMLLAAMGHENQTYILWDSVHPQASPFLKSNSENNLKSICWWMNRWNVAYPCKGKPSYCEKGQTTEEAVNEPQNAPQECTSHEVSTMTPLYKMSSK